MRADVRVGLDLLSLGAHEPLEVLGLRRHALRVLERRGDLLVRVLRDALGVGDGLVVQHEELLLRVVLATGERRLELHRAHAQLAHGILRLGARVLGLARDHRAQRRRALLGLGADRGGFALGLRDLLGGVRGLALDAGLVGGQLGLDAQVRLLRVVLSPRHDRLGLGLRLLAAIRDLFARGVQQAIALIGRVAQQHAGLVFGDPQHLFELVTARACRQESR